MRNRAARTAAAMSSPSAAAQSEKPRLSFFEWLRNIPRYSKEVRAEARKITWTSRKETWITSVMVAIMVALAALFFWVVDLALSFGVTQVLKLANAG